MDPATSKSQLLKLEEHRSNRNLEEVAQALDGLRAVLEDDRAAIMPAILLAVKSYATVGEISGAMRDAFGEYRAPTVL